MDEKQSKDLNMSVNIEKGIEEIKDFLEWGMVIYRTAVLCLLLFIFILAGRGCSLHEMNMIKIDEMHEIIAEQK